MSQDDLSVIAGAFRQSPRVLLLGQQYTGSGAGDAFSLTLETKVGATNLYQWWLKDSRDLGARADAIAEIGRVALPDEPLMAMLHSSWHCVFASSIDSMITRALEIRERRLVHQVLSPGFAVAKPPHLTLVRLFGSVDRPSVRELPPADMAELRRRRSQAVEMLAGLPEAAGPNGHVFVEGWDPQTDWLRPRDLVLALTAFSRGQVLLFGLRTDQEESLRQDDDFSDLVEAGVVTIFSAPLTQALAELRQRGDLDLGEDLTALEDTIFLEVARKTPEKLERARTETLVRLSIPRLDWARLSQSMTMIEPLDPTKPLPGTADERYAAFRNFLSAGPDSQRHWLRHLAFRRSLLNRMVVPTVFDLCNESAPQDHVVILSGQSGSGKSVLLNLVALEMRRAGFPVVHVGRGIVSANQTHIDEFCQLVETVTSIPVVVVYDGNQQDVEYLDLAAYLASRGRKCLIVGSSYPFQGQVAAQATGGRRHGGTVSHVVPIPVAVDIDERTALLDHIGKFVPHAREDLSRLAEGYDSFFAILYRLLPSTRRRISEGIIAEIERNADLMQQRIDEARLRPEYVSSNMTAMEMALRQALGNELERLLPPERQVASDADGNTYKVTDATRLVDAVMFVSRMGLQLPQEMALRLLGNNYAAYRGCIRGWNVIIEVGDEEIALEARNPLEAEIWTERKYPSSEDQVEVLRELVQTVRPHEMNDDTGPELNLVVKLLQNVGPQGPDRFRLGRHFLEIALIVRELRLKHREVHPRLLLVECNAVREWVQREQWKLVETSQVTSSSADIRNQSKSWSEELERAEQAIDAAEDVVRRNGTERLPAGARRLMSVLETERACVLGARQGIMKLLVKSTDQPNPEWIASANRYLKQAASAWRESLRYQEDNFRALDAACWIIRDRIEIGELSIDDEVGLLADWSEIIDRYAAVELPPSQSDHFDDRDLEYARAMGDEDRIGRVMLRLGERNVSTAHTVRARLIEQEEGKQAALQYLEHHSGSESLSDRAFLLLYFRLWWETETNLQGYFPKDRLRLAFSHSQWDRLRELADARLRLEGEQDNCTALFQLAWSLMQLGRTAQAREVFARLEMVSLGSFRRSRSLALLTDGAGKARVFTGETRPTSRGDRAYAWVDDLRMEVPYNPSEFDTGRGRPGQILGQFHVSLNYRGPYAEPTWRLAAHDSVLQSGQDKRHRRDRRA